MKVCATCGTEYADDQKFCPKDGSALRSLGTSDLVGSVIAERYHIVKKLGEGGMGAVYLGEHVKMHRKSAIKVMSQSMANDPDAIARFNREAANAARITHPNVCAIYDFGETQDGLIYLAMEFIEGEALTDLIEREGALAPQRAAHILEQAGDALQAAHDLGIVHRDLKPDNIMITRGRDGADVVKVVDFGIAKAMSGEEGQKVTKTGLVVGTPEYMSPEQLSGDKLDGRSDIYSLALVLYRMLTGTLPFQADSAQEVMIKRLTDQPMPLNESVPGANFPAQLQQVLDHALSRMPTERYDSAAQFAKDVVQAVSGMSDRVTAPLADAATQLMDAQAAPTPAPTVAKTQVAGGASQPPGGTPTPDTAQPRPSVAAPPAKKRSPVLAIAAAVVIVGGGATAAFMLHGSNANKTAATTPDSAMQHSPVTTDTAPRTAANNPTGSAPSSGAARPQDTQHKAVTPPVSKPEKQVATQPTGQAANPPASTAVVDTAAIGKELYNMIDDMVDSAKRPGVIRRAQDIYDNEKLPADLRISAAETVAAAFTQGAQVDAACRWYDKALQLNPPAQKEQRLQDAKKGLGCAP